ncbi:MAG: putative minor tail protein [Prokaryotic dsDNA virus sp.]|nr:MAG: putative minor tail protein [Prokaryotic dsDNA virus sp.]
MAISNIDLRVNSQHAVRNLRNAQTASNRLAGSVKGLTGALGLLGGGLLLAGAVRNYFKGFNEAEKATMAVKTLGVDVDVLSHKLLELSNNLEGAFSQTELLTASYDVASAGFTDAADAAAILEASSKGAVGGMSDLGTVSDAVTSVINAFGLEANQANKIVDGFIQTQNDGKIIVAQYARQIGRIAPTAAAAGISIDQLNAAIATITAQGVPVEQTFTGLNQAIVSILKPTGEAEKIAKKLGIEFDAAALKSKGFEAILRQIADSGATTDQIAKLFGSVEAMKAVFPLINDDLVKFNENLVKQKDSSGAAAGAMNTMNSTLSQQFSNITKQIGNLVRALDEVLGPALKGILDIIGDIVGKAATALTLMQDLQLGAAYKKLGQAGSDITLGGLAAINNPLRGLIGKDQFTAFGLERMGLGKLKDAVELGAGTISTASSVEELEKIEVLLNKVQVQAKRLEGKGNVEQINQLLFLIQDTKKTIAEKEAEILAVTEGTKTANEDITGEVLDRKTLMEQLVELNGTEFNQLTELGKLYEQIGTSIRTGMVDAIQGAINGTKTLGEVATAVFGQIQRSLIQYGVNAFLGSLGGGIGQFFSLSGNRATGGAVLGGSSYLVGERGPEIFTPSSSGMISTGMGTNVTVNVDASGTTVEGDEDRGKNLGRLIAVAVQSEIITQQRPGGLLA